MRPNTRDIGYEPEHKSSVPFWIIAVAAVAIGFTVVLFAPRFYTVQRTSALPPFRGQEGASPVHGTQGKPATRYAGKGVEEMGRIADSICMQLASSRMLAAPSSSAAAPLRTSIVENADENDRLVCRLTEAPERYCSAGQRQKIAAEVIGYFNGIARNRTALRSATTQDFPADPRVMDGVDALIHAGYLPRSSRDDINTSVPKPIRDRFDHIVPMNPNCPQPPWWAFWKRAG
jgi:hypothetical protein